MERRALEDEREKFESQKRMALQEEIRERERLRKEHEERKKNMDREKSEREQIWLQVFINKIFNRIEWSLVRTGLMRFKFLGKRKNAPCSGGAENQR